ncbi:MAG: KpsF/GutQ family sugar-phosphate isomerase [Gammaproteobacteria bacterium]|nr:D-arabinose 5-phosphate isomerase [Gammaproteobacteria bacterium]
MKRVLDAEQLLARGRRVLETEIVALTAVQQRLQDSFVKACQILHACKGRVVVSGMGKSGHIGNKIAATLASTGTPAFFLHPAEAGHGDIGMITADDVLLALSNSGETPELLTILPAVKRLGIPIVVMTGAPASTLAKAATVVLDVSVPEEACPHNLAPTASTTAALAMGDALAVAILEARGFTPEDFARSHPGGTLGRKLLLRIEDVMRTGEQIPMVGPDSSLRDGLIEMSRKGLGMTAIVDGEGKVLGIFTDGDLRRTLDRDPDLRGKKMADVMSRNPKTVTADMLAAEAVRLLEASRITQLLVVDERDVLIGALNIHDLFRAGVM